MPVVSAGDATAEAVQARIRALMTFPITDGNLFRRIRHGRLVGPLYNRAVRDIVRHRARMAEHSMEKLPAHSPRSVLVTEVGTQGISLGGTMAMTGHRNLQSVMY